MRINYIIIERDSQGNITPASNILNSKCHYIVNTINCMGTMGKGVALLFAQRYPHILRRYKQFCTEGAKCRLLPGMIYQESTDPNPRVMPSQFILNVATKDHWRNPSQLKWIEEILQKIFFIIPERHITSIALPPLGCGNGQLSWDQVGPLMAQYLEPLEGGEIDIYIERGMKQYHLPQYQQKEIPTDGRPGYYRIKPISIVGHHCDVIEITKSGHIITGTFQWLPSWSDDPLFPGDLDTPESGYVYREPFCDTIFLNDEEMTNPNPPANWQSLVIEFLEDRKMNIAPLKQSIPGYES